MHFWDNLHRPYIGLAPMDGITDSAYRTIHATYGKPALMYTEFVPVEAIKAGATRVLDAWTPTPTVSVPTIAQIYGADLDAYKLAAKLILSKKFAGIDINMGCPAKSVTGRGAGAGLIRNPIHAVAIIRTVQDVVGNAVPVSVKTRIGYDMPAISEWFTTLAQENLAAIAIHGRTFSQLYSGKAQWDLIAQATRVIKKIAPQTHCVGNGDIHTAHDAHFMALKYKVDGVLIGRATWGNPWIYTDTNISPKERIAVARTHAHLFVQLYPQGHILALRKHLAWYCSGFAGASLLRQQLLTVKTLSDIEEILQNALYNISGGGIL